MDTDSGPHPSSDTPNGRQRRGCGCGFIVGLLGALVALIGVLWTMFNVDYMRTWACAGPRIPAITAEFGYCDGFERVPIRTAEQTFDMYLRSAAGSQPERALEHLSASEREAIGEARFVKDWSGILFAELNGPATPTGERDRYVLPYRVYFGEDNEVDKGRVTSYKQLVEFEDTGSEILIVDLEPRVKDSNYEVQYVPLRLLPETTTRQRPTHESQAMASTIGAGEISAGGMLRSVCQTSVGPDWWSRTPLGWLAHADTQTGNVTASGGIQCDPHHALEVVQETSAPEGVPSS